MWRMLTRQLPVHCFSRSEGRGERSPPGVTMIYCAGLGRLDEAISARTLAVFVAPYQ
jgi:hypothetical protein